MSMLLQFTNLFSGLHQVRVDGIRGETIKSIKLMLIEKSGKGWKEEDITIGKYNDDVKIEDICSEVQSNYGGHLVLSFFYSVKGEMENMIPKSGLKGDEDLKPLSGGLFSSLDKPGDEEIDDLLLQLKVGKK